MEAGGSSADAVGMGDGTEQDRRARHAWLGLFVFALVTFVAAALALRGADFALYLVLVAVACGLGVKTLGRTRRPS